MKTGTSNIHRFGLFAPIPERATWDGDFSFRVRDWSAISDNAVRDIIRNGRTYLDRNSARVEWSERQIMRWWGTGKAE
jgi:hypothetical protein